ncbi:hypothetical protein [Microcoleus sp. herbarium12]|uniref:hypothetical protein n=1 Tax=Microcoleus sp. herbarium12 TaxID=3055437 RepID=UPI002FCE7598
MSSLNSDDLDATVDVLNLTAVLPREHPIAQLHIDCPPAVGAASEKNLQPALRKLLEFRNRRATVRNLDIPGTIPVLSLKPYARSYAPGPLSWIAATLC